MHMHMLSQHADLCKHIRHTDSGVRYISGASLDSWAWWNQVRCMCAHQGQLGVALTLGAAVPSHSALQRWFGEPVRAIVVPTSIFQTNKRGFPALPKAHQAVLVSFFQLNVQVDSAAKQVACCVMFLGGGGMWEVWVCMVCMFVSMPAQLLNSFAMILETKPQRSGHAALRPAFNLIRHGKQYRLAAQQLHLHQEASPSVFDVMHCP